MLNLIKKILSFFTEKKEVETEKETNSEVYPLGAILREEDEDTRDIVLDMVQVPKPISMDSYKTDLSMFPVFNQGILGTCVAHAYVLIKMFLDFVETKEVQIYSRRCFYVIARMFAGWPVTNELSNQGLSVRQSAKVLSTVGVVHDKGQDNDSLSHYEYVIGFKITDEIRKNAVLHRSGKYAFPLRDAESLTQAIYQNKVVGATLAIDWSKIQKDGTIGAPKKISGTHQVVFYGWEKRNGQKYFIFRNSWGGNWGTNGDGYIAESEVESVVVDLIVFTDVPNELIERAKNLQYIFITTLRLGSSGEAVKQLQKRLIEYGLLEGNADGRFGKMTDSAVREFQNLKGLLPDGIVGKGTRDALNAETPQGKTKAKLDLWIEAITKIEGGKPSMNNPGNIKCGQIMHRDATGYDYRGICIFPNEQKGYMALRELLVRAATGGSKNYHPDMTLYEFYAGVSDKKKYGRVINGYAPESDNNKPNPYAESVAKIIGVSPSIQIKDLLI